MSDYKYFCTLNNRFDLNLLKRTGDVFPFDAVADLRYECCPIRHDLKPFRFYSLAALFGSVGHSGSTLFGGLFDVRGMQFEKIPQWIDAFAYKGANESSFSYDFRIWQKSGVPQIWDSIDRLGSPKRTDFSWRHDLIVAVREKHGCRYDSIAVLNPSEKHVFGYDILKLYRERISAIYDAIPCDFLARLNVRFDANRRELAVLPTYRQSLVMPGWRIFARNLDTDASTELGFINADASDRALNDVFLPDGPYEITVLTSSLFWKDAADQSIRTIILGPDAEITPLPTIYNLRSSVRPGTTLIQWSATKSELNDAVFGVWYGSESPVDTARPPDATIWYSSSMTEYQTTFEQHAPARVAVTAVKPGDETQTGKVHELYLDWNDTTPRPPDDVMVLPEPITNLNR